jgi:hypothetical protein
MTFEEQAALMGQTGVVMGPTGMLAPHWADVLMPTQGPYIPSWSVALQHQHPLYRGWSQRHLDALLDVELGL